MDANRAFRNTIAEAIEQLNRAASNLSDEDLGNAWDHCSRALDLIGTLEKIEDPADYGDNLAAITITTEDQHI